jgi:maltose alpha-D-glucosyltransferase / alpha-amylase
MARRKELQGPDEPLWYKDAVFYEARVRSFFDSDGDGVGDFRGLTAKLDYLEDLGVTTLWLLPFYPSPQRDDGYDIADYTDVHPELGTLQDFKVFLREAHRRHLHVVTELVINHTSDQHPWFQRARRAPPGSVERDFYVWSDTADKYLGARIIFRDFETSNWTYDPVARAHFWHRFYSHQPDLNFDNAAVRAAVLKVLDFWLGLGVDGLRLDAVPYLFEREGTSCENLPETHDLLRDLRRHVDARYKNRMLLAEANQWPEDAVAYFGQGDECHMAFHFPIMPRLYLSVRTEDRFPIADIWAQTPAIPESCQWALFLRNHDELTLEMVTDEERDYLYRAYADEPRMRINLGIRRRLAPIFGNNRRAIELMNGLLLSLPGTPVVYYGDEIGMGDNIYLGDRNGVRTPMQWSADRNAGFSTADAQRLVLPPITGHEYHYEAVNVETQQRNRHSLLWWMKRIITLRKRHSAFGRGDMEILNPDNPRVLAFIRRHGDEQILVVANLSRFVQPVRLALGGRRGLVPVELFGRTAFPPIGDGDYLLTLGPHGFFWFELQQPRRQAMIASPQQDLPTLRVSGRVENVITGRGREALLELLPDYLMQVRWFGGKARSIKGVELSGVIPVPDASVPSFLTLARVEYADGEAETYLLPLALVSGHRADEVCTRYPGGAIALCSSGQDEPHLLIDAMSDPEFCQALLSLIDRRRKLHSSSGEIAAVQSSAYLRMRTPDQRLEARPLGVEQSNTSVLFGDRFILKLFRRVEPGTSPELELTRHLTEKAGFQHAPALAGWLDLRSAPHAGLSAGRGEPTTLGVLQAMVPNEGDAWRFTKENVKRYFERVAARPTRAQQPRKHLLDLVEEEAPDEVRDRMGGYLEAAQLLGRRTGELHVALTDAEDPGFRPEPVSGLDQRSTYQSMRNLTGNVLRTLARQLDRLPDELRPAARALLAAEKQVVAAFEAFLRQPTTALRSRIHGDYHLGQVLYTGKDFVIIDFEGEPARPLSERRRKRRALRDVAGMLRSFHYAAFGTLFELREQGLVGGHRIEELTGFADLWQIWASWAFLRGYLEVMRGSALLPLDRVELQTLLDTYLLEKAIYELGYELNNRPAWVQIPLHGIAQICRL